MFNLFLFYRDTAYRHFAVLAATPATADDALCVALQQGADHVPATSYCA